MTDEDAPPIESTRHRRLTPLGEALGRARPSRRLWDTERRQQLESEVFYEGSERTPYLSRFGTLIVLSTALAAFGLVANSAAVVIGAMLIAPLMTPILGTAAAIMLADLRRVATSIGILLAGTLGAIATAWVVAAIGLSEFTAATGLPNEILSRTEPSLLDLGVAVVAGIAAGYVLTHPTASGSLPGVAIAVALVPPLATVGITWQLGATGEARGALLLFLTNLVAILLSAIVMMLAAGYLPPDIRIKGLGHVRFGIVVVGLALVAIAVPLTAHTVETIGDQGFQRDTVRAIEEWDPNAFVVTLSADLIGNDRATVDLVIATTSADPPPAWELAETLALSTGRVVEVDVRYQLEERDAGTAG